MTAAAITPSVVCKTEKVMDSITGTPIRVTEYYLKATKSTASDWILLEGAIGDTTKNMVGCHGIVIDSSDDMTLEAATYDDSADKLVLAAAGVGTVHMWVTMAHA